MGCNPQNIKSDTRFRNKHCAASIPDIKKRIYMDHRHKYRLLCIQDTKIVYHEFQREILRIMETRHRYILSLIPDRNIVRVLKY